MDGLDSISNSQLEYVINRINEISTNTDALGSGFSIFLTVLSIVASIVTIIGLLSIVHQYRKQQITKKRQEYILLDLIRHFFINAAIMEVVRMKMKDKWDKFHPAEGVFSRFCVLNTDLQLDRIQVKDYNYTKLHSLALVMRNYNIMAELAEKHFNDPTYDPKEKERELDDLWERTQRITERFIEFGKETDFNINKGSILTFINEYYEEMKEKDREKGKELPNIDIPKREGIRGFYDEVFELKDILDYCIRNRYNSIRVNPF